MQLKSLKLTNFRNYREASVTIPPGTTIIVGGNAAGKTNLLEAAQYTLCGTSFRTSRDVELIRTQQTFFRNEAEVENGAVFTRAVSLQGGSPVRVDSGGGPKWLAPGLVLCFSPDDLQLIKGAPAGRRRFLDEAIARRSPTYRRSITDYQKTLAQRNSFLQRARSGLVQLTDIVPWDRQLASLGQKIYVERRRYCLELAPYFSGAIDKITGEPLEADVLYLSQLGELGREDELDETLVARLRESWSVDIERLSTSVGTHRDDVDFILAGKSLKPYGSQGEQRSAVLALLLAERSLSAACGGEPPLLILDDVMSELDPDRRRRLMETLASNCDAVSAPGQVIISAADTGLFSEQELLEANVIYVGSGSLEPAGL